VVGEDGVEVFGGLKAPGCEAQKCDTAVVGVGFPDEKAGVLEAVCVAADAGAVDADFLGEAGGGLRAEAGETGEQGVGLAVDTGWGVSDDGVAEIVSVTAQHQLAKAVFKLVSYVEVHAVRVREGRT
jgi:hypothetical protein